MKCDTLYKNAMKMNIALHEFKIIKRKHTYVNYTKNLLKRTV